MAVFTALTRADATALLEHYQVGELVDLQGIGSGIENTNYFLTTDRGAYVLTLFERLTAEQLPFYLQLMRHLAQRGLPVPAPAATRSGALLTTVKGKPAAIVTRQPGHAQLAPDAGHCAQIGAMLARIHLAAADFPLFQCNLHGIGWWKAVLPQLEPFVTDRVYSDLAEEVMFQDSFVRSADFEQLARGPIHADLFRDNVLFDGEEIGGVIDFYFAGCSVWLFDVAVTVNDWCVDLDSGAIDPARAVALLAAYHAQRPLTEVEHRSWRTVLRAAALRFWLSRLYDRYLPRSAQLLAPHDPARFERMLRQRASAAHLPWP